MPKPAAASRARHARLAAGDAAGEADPQHARAQRRTAGALPPPARGRDRVPHEQGDGQRAHSARHRGEGARHLAHGRGVDVAHQHVALARELVRALRSASSSRGRRGVVDAVHADVDHHRARLHVLAAHEAGAADGGHQHVRLPRDRGEVAACASGQTVTVASACRRSSAIGLPTMSLRPSTTARRPATAIALARAAAP